MRQADVAAATRALLARAPHAPRRSEPWRAPSKEAKRGKADARRAKKPPR